MSAPPPVHAVFDLVASAPLRQALRFCARNERVIALTDDLSLGPIDRTDGEARTRWLREQFGGDAYEEPADIDGFWSEVASPKLRIVAYVSRRNAREYAGLHELLRRRGNSALEIVDVTNIDFLGPDGKPDLEKSLAVAELGPAQIVERRVLESAAPLSADEKKSYPQHWAKLREENTPLRIITNGILVSAPITHFDASMMSCATLEWQSPIRLLGSFHGAARARGIAPPELRFLLSRLAALVGSGQLECQGDLATLRTLRGHQHSSLRRPQRSPG